VNRSKIQAEAVCTLSEEAQVRRAQEVRQGLARRVRAMERLPDGMRVRFDADADTEAEVRAFASFESGCCGFAAFEVMRDDAAVWLTVRGPEGTADLVSGLLAPPQAASEPRCCG